ncbi:Transcriptional regulator containing an amidase domain and an AraC-type DNA-binding HTH domain (plasmid) [Rubrobacter radiotolerans]|uniref:Transcriptional regulator containing an amidase domain and an AraC-type DNA-binding HTH domain n=1 Tax=Rubrobacter radiotolerans TaxID=42256 RepID=A0A023X755_RUBRA|nr:helix-turn-helix domain-containing protein [Rubrobacter radiotolerans]AHY48153.1 Transcriptional regulator containing an amidase domain and an AraC-type DNA-binding HTH domain [Rubrobacter radiotolerans]
MHAVALVVFDGMPAFEMAVPCEVFGTDRSAAGLPNYRFMVCAAEPGPLLTAGGMTVEAPFGLADLRQADTVIVPAWRDPDETPPPALLGALRACHERGARIASLCLGAFVLAHAGLLDGLRATTHWVHADAFARKFPDVDLDPSVLYVDEGKILTSAGTGAAIDLCLHMVREDHGAEVANGFARRMVVSPHRDGGQAQYAPAPVAKEAGGPLADTLEWASANLGEPLTVARLSSHARMSERTFARRFREATGTTPLRWVLGRRVLAAQGMLEASAASVDEIARCCGFGTGAALRVHFKRTVGVPPTDYRKTFGRGVGRTVLPGTTSTRDRSGPRP